MVMCPIAKLNDLLRLTRALGPIHMGSSLITSKNHSGGSLSSREHCAGAEFEWHGALANKVNWSWERSHCERTWDVWPRATIRGYNILYNGRMETNEMQVLFLERTQNSHN